MQSLTLPQLTRLTHLQTKKDCVGKRLTRTLSLLSLLLVITKIGREPLLVRNSPIRPLEAWQISLSH